VDPEQVWSSLDSLADVLAHNPIKPVVLGFSQGGILANALAATHPELIQGCAAVASYFPNDWFDSALEWKAQTELPHLAVVGDEDGVIPPALSVPSYETANARGAGIEVQRFRMGHGIAPDSWQAIARWLSGF
jgi:predicted esterase